MSVKLKPGIVFITIIVSFIFLVHVCSDLNSNF